MSRDNIRAILLIIGLLPVTMPAATAAAFEFREPLRRAYDLESVPALNDADPPLWLPGRTRDAKPQRVLFSHRLVLQLRPGAELIPVLENHRLTLERVVEDDLFIAAARSAREAVEVAAAFAGHREVVACYPVMRRELALDGAYAPRPNDYYFKLQGYHEFRDADGKLVGADINTRSAWAITRGAGVILVVADTGVQPSHPEIANQLAPGRQHNFATGADDGAATALTASWVHGMSVAGLALAQGNNSVGMIGVAPEAKLASWVIFDSSLMRVGEDKLMELYPRDSGLVWVQNHSWSKGDVPGLGGPGLLELSGLNEAFTNGRDGKGVVMVRSGGNYRLVGRNASEDLYVSDPRVIAVAAVNNSGRAASYSSPGAPLLVSAPGGEATAPGPFMFTLDFLGADGATPFRIVLPGEEAQTQDLWNYRWDFNSFAGTSAAAPLVAGTASLMLSVNPDLNYRDVQHILLLAARHLDTADPDLHANGAGFLVSHNQGFGVVDAGQAVRLAQGWINRPAAVWITNTVTVNQPVADDSLRVELTDASGTVNVASIRTLPGLGPHADEPTGLVNIVDVGLANTPIAADLSGKAALIERGGSDFSVKIGNAAAAGAVFAVIYNYVSGSGFCPGGDQLCPLGGTDYTPIPAVFIRNSDGQLIKNQLTLDSGSRARLAQSQQVTSFNVATSLQLEHAGVRLKTDHPLRGDLRVTLLSPKGTRSVLQRYNADTNAGPVDWTYFSTHHFHEASAGEWRVEVSDQGEGAVGNVLEASLLLQGVPVVDTDADGLADGWENTHFLSLAEGPGDDPDSDGYSNAREQVMQTDPMVAEIPFKLEPDVWNARLVRLSWPGVDGADYEVLRGEDVTSLQSITNVAGVFPETVWFTTYTNLATEFFQVRRLP